MTVKEAKKIGKSVLQNAGVPDADVDAQYLLCHVLSCDRMTLPLHSGETLSQTAENAYTKLLYERSRRVPLQYLLKSQAFFGRDFYVDSNVLIPRPETELLCEQALFAIKEKKAPRALDLCTGSGALAVTLACERPDCAVFASDISAPALSIAKRNADQHGAAVAFFEGDLFAPFSDERFDLIVCNPPYIGSEACEFLQPEVSCEPRLALDGGKDGLAFYRRLAKEAPAYLTPAGRLIVELGDGQSEAVRRLFDKAFTDVAILPDYQGLPRMALATLR